MKGPQVPPAAIELLDRLVEYNEPISRGEIELYVPPEHRNPGLDWVFTRGMFLTRTKASSTERVHSIAGFDVADEKGVDEETTVYRTLYGYYDHTHQLHTFNLPPFRIVDGYVSGTETELRTRPGSAFIMSFDRRAPGTHRIFDKAHRDYGRGT
jgi:hypothetical protein